MTVTGLAGIDVCGSLCLLAGNLTCHYYLYTSGICYLGNILTNKSVIAQRSDSQNIYTGGGREGGGWREPNMGKLFVQQKVFNTYLVFDQYLIQFHVQKL